jgi:phosphinothricin acetyltransferase
MTIQIESMTSTDWPEVKHIYQQGIETGNATFASSPPMSWQEWQSEHIESCSIVARSEAAIGGWAALTPVSSRCIYAGVAEVSIYISEGNRGLGIGSQLLEALLQRSEANGIWTLQAGIFPENQASILLHKKLGFKEIGLREKIGRMAFGKYKDVWRDVLLMERRSQRVGIH